MFKLVSDKKIYNPIIKLVREKSDYLINIPRDVLYDIIDYIDSDISNIHLISNYSSLRGFNIPFNYFPYDFGISITSKKSLQEYIHLLRNKDLTLEYDIVKYFPNIVNESLRSFIYRVVLPYTDKLSTEVLSVRSNILVNAMKKVLIAHIFNHVMIPYSIEFIAECDHSTTCEKGFCKDKVVLSIKFIDMYYNTFYNESGSFDDNNKSLIGYDVSRALLQEFSFFCKNGLNTNDMVEILHMLANTPVIYDTTTVSTDIDVNLNNSERYMLNMFIDFDIYYKEIAKKSERINKVISSYIQDNYSTSDTEPKGRDIYLEFINKLAMLSKYYVDTEELPDINIKDNYVLVNGDIACKLSRLGKMEYSDFLNKRELLYNLLKGISKL